MGHIEKLLHVRERENLSVSSMIPMQLDKTGNILSSKDFETLLIYEQQYPLHLYCTVASARKVFFMRERTIAALLIHPIVPLLSLLKWISLRKRKLRF